jgi:hypothetical protein
MKSLKPSLLLLAATLAFGALAPQQAHAQVTVSFFYNSLSPYGDWYSDPNYGYVWHPANMAPGWSPYSDGYWAYTDCGWTWVSYEDFGGIVYHYGRWAHYPGEGWVWIPGETWAPAWVSWRSNDDYVGWAPLPPEAGWHAGIGFGPWVDAHFDIGPACFSFVSFGDFGAPALGGVIVDRSRNVTIINSTTNITNITTDNGSVYTGGPEYARVAARSTHPIPMLKVVRRTSPGSGKLLAQQTGSSLYVVAPKVTAPEGGKLPPPPHVARTLTGVKADNGWGDVTDPKDRADLESKYKEAGTDEKPAKSVNPDDIKLVSDHIKAKGSKSLTAGENPTPTHKPKKTEDLTELENQPAAEATPKSKKHHETTDEDTAGTGETPKPKKTKTEDEYNDESGAGSEETPKPKKSKTPEESTDEGGSSKSSGGSSSFDQYMGGSTGSEGDTGKKTDESTGSEGSKVSDESDKGGSSGDSEKESKDKKKKKGEGESTPGQ